MKKALKILAIMLIIVNICGCSGHTKPDPKKYENYICYDKDLWCLKTESKIAYGDSKDTTFGSFQKIKGESDDKFVYARPWGLGFGLSSCILQNPNNRVDIWKEWTVEKIELYYFNGSSEQNGPSYNPNKIYASTENSVITTEISDIMILDDTPIAQDKISGELVFDTLTEKYNYKFSFRIRVHFKESENIVWDSPFEFFEEDATSGREFRIRKLFYVNEYYTNAYILVDNDTELFKWFEDSIKTLPENEL